MAIAGYKAPRREVPLAGAEPFYVKGLGLNEIAVLVETHFQDIEALLDLFVASGRNLTADDLRNIAPAIVSSAPGFAANLIALAADEPDAAPTIQNEFVVGTQIEAIRAIGDLTFGEFGGIKKGLEQVVALLASKREALTKTVKKKAG